MKKFMIAATALAAALILNSNAFAGDKEDVTKAIDGVAAALSACNIDKASEFWTKDATIFPPASPKLVTAAEDMASWKDGCAKGQKVSMSFKDVKMSIDGNLAVLTAMNVGTFTPPGGKAETFDYRFTGILKKEGGVWKGYHAHVSAPLTQPAPGHK